MTDFQTNESRLKKCPFCAEMIQEAAIICRHCGRSLTENQIMHQPKNNSGLAITSFAIGIFCLIAWFLPICGFPISVTGLILGILSMGSSKRNLAITGIVLSTIGLVLTIINGVLGAYFAVTGQLFQW